jgi:hypothetical protein
MSTIALGSVRSCGATTVAAGLAGVWPAPCVLIEFDPAGGVLAAAAGRPAEPGLVSLAAAARRQPDPGLLQQHHQELLGGVPVVCGPPSAEQARSALLMLAPMLDRLGEVDGRIVVDCGRLDPGSPALPVFAAASLGLLVVRPRLADLHAAGEWLRTSGRSRPAGLILVGSGPYPPAEISEALGVGVLGELPWDPEAAEALLVEPIGSRRLSRSTLSRSLRTLAGRLAEELAASLTSPPATPSSAHVEEPAKPVVEMSR